MKVPRCFRWKQDGGKLKAQSSKLKGNLKDQAPVGWPTTETVLMAWGLELFLSFELWALRLFRPRHSTENSEEPL